MNSNRFSTIFAKRPAFISYITAGDGGLEFSLQALLALVAGGVDILEIGVPFSDPIADGPVIQRAMHRALANEVSINDVLKLVQQLRQYTDVPILLFSYYNPILANQQHQFFEQAYASGVDGLLVVDLPIDEAEDYILSCRQVQIDPIFIITPTTSVERIIHIDQQSSAFLYYTSRKGITGIRQKLPEDIHAKLQQVKKLVKHPVVVGFGIGDANTAKSILSVADGFVVGSYFVQAIEEGASPAQLKILAQKIDPREKSSS